jgi:rRNA maturation endonuclease Nob1
MTASSYFGFRCPKCGSTVDIGAGSSSPTCPSCGTGMVSNPQFGGAAANVFCPHCKAAFGLTNSTKCPQCGGPFTGMPR